MMPAADWPPLNGLPTWLGGRGWPVVGGAGPPGRPDRPPGLRLLRILSRLHGSADRDDLELPVLGHRILIFLAQESLLDEDVDALGEVARAHLSLEVVDGPGVLLSAENELRFLLPLRLVPPDRHRHGHQQHHDGEADQQRRHGISPLTVLTP